MTPVEVRAAIIRALEEAVNISKDPRFAQRAADPNADIKFDEMELDSLSATEISLLIEDETGYVCDLGDFLCYPSLTELANHIAEQTGNRPGTKLDTESPRPNSGA